MRKFYVATYFVFLFDFHVSCMLHLSTIGESPIVEVGAKPLFFRQGHITAFPKGRNYVVTESKLVRGRERKQGNSCTFIYYRVNN